MNVLHVDTETGFRGGERQLILLCRGLRDRGVGVRVAVRGGEELERVCATEELPTVPLRQGTPWDPRAATRIRRELAAGQVDLVHAHTSHALTAAAAALRTLGPGSRSRPPLVVSRRVDFPIGRPPMNRFKYGRVVDRFLAISDAVSAVLQAGGVGPERISVVRSAVESLPEPVRTRAEVRAELGVGDGELLAVTTAALVDHKDHATAIAAFARVRGPVRLVVAGEGRLGGSLRRRIDAGGLGARVSLLGQRDDVPDLLRAADLYVAASHLEGLNTALMDAGLAGLPAVATRAGGIPEVVEDGVTGLLVPRRNPDALAAAIDRLAGDPELRAILGAAAARRVAAEFSVDRMVEQTLQAYERVLGPTMMGTDGVERPARRSRR